MNAVIPINIARGRATEKIRRFLLNNYRIQYLIKTTREVAFSEGAAFKDILFVAEKGKPSDHDMVNIVFLSTEIKNIEEKKINELIDEIANHHGFETDVILKSNYQLWRLATKSLKDNQNNLMMYLRGNDIRTRKDLMAFLEVLSQKSGDCLRNLESHYLRNLIPSLWSYRVLFFH